MVRSSALIALLFASSVFAQTPKDDLAPFLDDQVVAVARLRPDKTKDATLAELDRKLTPAELRDIDGWKSPVSLVRERASEWAAAGGGDVYVVISFQDVPRRAPFAVLLPQAGKRAEDLIAVVKRWDAHLPLETIGRAIVVAHPEIAARLKTAKPTERADLIQALSSAPDEAARIVVSPSAETRRVYRESLPALPPGLSSATSKDFLDSAKLLTVQLDLSAEPALRLNLQAKDAETAQSWKDLITSAARLATGNEALLKQFPGLKQPAANPAPIVKGDRVEIAWGQDGDRLSQLVNDLLQPAVRDAYYSAATAESVNDLKHIMLAMHNYLDRYKTFPPRAILSKDGKPLLSWRVALLPYLDAEALYKEFKLDEPWDSEHNRKLIDKMPAVFASNLLPAGKTKAGITPYVVPVGAGTCFGKPEGIAIKEITDGTSNTVGVTLALPSAVEWTKPADWEVDFKNVARGWRREPVQPHDGLICGYCDGSVHRLPATLPEETIRRLILIADGNVIELPR